MDAKKIGNAIRILRKQLDYTQHDLAECLNVTDKAVSKWERGLSIPDIAVLSKLAQLLNCDLDNLLEGNITYLEKNWQGLLVLKDNETVFSGSEAYGKPLVYFFLSYFMLAGIGEIYILCPEKDRTYLELNVGDGSTYGINLYYLPLGATSPPVPGNTMVVFNNPFVYGPNLTRYFQRAMSNNVGVTTLTIKKSFDAVRTPISCDNKKHILPYDGISELQYLVPIMFITKNNFELVKHFDSITSHSMLFAEPMGNGMIEYSIQDNDSLWETSMFLRFLKKNMGKDIYELGEIAKNRNFK